MTVPEANDEIAIVDASAATTKKITRNDFLKGAALPADTVTTAAIADGAVTPEKLNLVTQTITFSVSESEGNWPSFNNVFYIDRSSQDWPIPFTRVLWAYVQVSPGTSSAARLQVWTPPPQITNTGVNGMRFYKPSLSPLTYDMQVIAVGEVN